VTIDFADWFQAVSQRIGNSTAPHCFQCAGSSLSTNCTMP
jgi:hypothetical protein